MTLIVGEAPPLRSLLSGTRGDRVVVIFLALRPFNPSVLLLLLFRMGLFAPGFPWFYLLAFRRIGYRCVAACLATVQRSRTA